MLTVHTTASPTALLAPMTSASTPAPSAEGSGQPSAFARMLQDSQPPAAAPAPAAANAPKHDSQDAAARPHEASAEPHRDAETQAPASHQAASAQHPTSTREATRSRDDAKRTAATKAPAHPGSDRAAREAKDVKDAKDASDDAAATTEARDEAAVAQDPALANWLANLKLPDPQQPAAPTGGPATPDAKADAAAHQAAAASSATTLGTPATTPPANDSAAAQVAAGQAAAATLAGTATPPDAKPAPAPTAAGTGRERGVDVATRGAEAAESAGAALAAAVRARAEQGDAQAGAGGQGDAGKAPAGWTPVSSASAASNLPATALPMQAASVAANAARQDSEPVTVTVQTPVNSPEFPRAMGVELAVLARDGVEQAELHLTPDDMGPVSVQIAIDGTQARIDFGADMASTRQAIEAGLPELASALRDAGLTLTGGGVSQHSRGRSEGGEAQASGRGPGGSDGLMPAATPAPTRRLVRAGGVDMYA